MNRRLQKGELLGKITASILASVMLVPSLPVAAQDAVSSQGSDTTVRTLAPLSDSEPAQAEAPKPGLQFTETPGGADSGPSFVPAGTTAGAAPSTLPATAASAPVAAEAAAPPAVLTPQEVAATASDAIAPAAAEVSAPAPLVAEKLSADGQEVAQTPNSPRQILDPAFTKKTPGITGTVKIRRGFDRFASNELIRNLAFRDTPVKEVVAELGRRGNLNIVIDKSVVGRITGDLHDVTLNEAMESVLASAGLDYRTLDNSTVVIGTRNALFNLGLNRPLMRVYKLSYASAFDVANLLWASVFNRGMTSDFTTSIRNRSVNLSRETPVTKSAEEVLRVSQAPAPGGGTQTSKTTTLSSNSQDQNEENEAGEEQNLLSRPDTQRVVRGSQREQVNEGTGFNSGAIDPGSQTIRTTATVVTDYNVDQNGGAAICIPDTRNRQIIIVGTEQDLQIAEEAIRLIDRRPKQIHIQTSLVELTNQGIRQLGAALNLQGEGASGTVLGGAGAPMIAFLPGLGSVQQFLTQAASLPGVQLFRTDRVSGIPPTPTQFTNFIGALQATGGSLGNPGETPQALGDPVTLGQSNLTDVPGPPANGFAGFLGNALPLNPPSIAGIQAVPQAQTGFNFLTLSKRAGGRANIATLPSGLNLTVNMVLQTNKAKVLANPSVIVSDNTESLITLANEVVHKVTTTISLGVVSTNVELVKAGVFLNVLPKAAEDGFVTMRIRPQVSSPLGGPQIFANGNVVVTLLNVREIISQEVRVKDGQTLVLGGLFTEQEAATLAKVPYLAEAPILGAIFRNSIKGRNRTELMLMITPKIVEEPPTAPTLGDASGAGPAM
jgi:type II secretory pathway component GspD/PulD (secretin)